MLQDNSFINSMPSIHSLDSSQDIEARKVLDFIDSKIEGFPSFLLKTIDSNTENRITDSLINYLEFHKSVDMPFRFGKNPTQPGSTRETDIGVFPRPKILTSSPITILEFEAKRLSTTSNYKKNTSMVHVVVWSDLRKDYMEVILIFAGCLGMSNHILRNIG